MQKLFVEGDIVRGNTPDGATGPICVLANQFLRRRETDAALRAGDQRDLSGE